MSKSEIATPWYAHRGGPAATPTTPTGPGRLAWFARGGVFLAVVFVGFFHVIGKMINLLTAPAMELLQGKEDEHGIVVEQITPVLTVCLEIDGICLQDDKPLQLVEVQSIANQAVQEVFDQVAANVLSQHQQPAAPTPPTVEVTGSGTVEAEVVPTTVAQTDQLLADQADATTVAAEESVEA